MMSIVDCFSQEPLETLLEQCTKEQLLKMTDHYNIEIGANRQKDTEEHSESQSDGRGDLVSEKPKQLPRVSVFND